MALTLESTFEVRDRCLCFRAQRAGRVLARRFDAALRPIGLTNGQFSLMMSLNRPDPPTMAEVAPFLGMDRTSLTASLKPLEKRGLVRSEIDAKDRRARRLALTEEGRVLLDAALPIWRDEHDRLDAELGADARALRDAVDALGAP
jgi:DNA-binding MarR family transcriptional regulator